MILSFDDKRWLQWVNRQEDMHKRVTIYASDPLYVAGYVSVKEPYVHGTNYVELTLKGRWAVFLFQKELL
jgi:hypothetical protein